MRIKVIQSFHIFEAAEEGGKERKREFTAGQTLTVGEDCTAEQAELWCSAEKGHAELVD